MGPYASLAAVLVGIFLWFVFGGFCASAIYKISDFDEWRYRNSDRMFERKFDPSSEADYYAVFFGFLSVFTVAYHMWVVEWDREQRRLYRKFRRGQKEDQNTKRQIAVDTLRANLEKQQERKMARMEQEVGID